MTPNSGKANPQKVVAILVAIVAAAMLHGCAGASIAGPTYTAAGTAVAVLHKERQEFRSTLKSDYSAYQNLFSASECKPEEYEISEGILNYLEDSAPTEDGFAEAQEILIGIYKDETLTTDVRAHALYLTALTEAEKENGSREQAREYLRRVKEEFPGTHDCAVDVLLEKGRKITIG